MDHVLRFQQVSHRRDEAYHPEEETREETEAAAAEEIGIQDELEPAYDADTQDEEEHEEETPGSGRGWMFAFIVSTLLGGAAAYGAYHFYSQHTALQQSSSAAVESAAAAVDSVVVLHRTIEQRLVEIETTVAQFESDNNDLQARLDEALAQVSRYRGQINSTAALKKSVAEYQAKLAEVEKTKADLDADIVALNDQVKSLQAENAGLQAQIDALRNDKKSLNSEIEQAADVKLHSLSVEPQQQKRRGALPTTSAKQTDLLVLGVTIGENRFAQAGEKAIHFVVTDPEGYVLAENEEETFRTAGGEAIPYTMQKNVSYQRKAERIMLNWEGTSKYIPGEYQVEVFMDGEPSISRNFTLR